MFVAAIVFVVAIAVFALMRIALRKQKLSLSMFFLLYAISLLGIALVALTITGRLHWLFGLIGTLLPFSGGIFRWGGRAWTTAMLIRRLRGFKRDNQASAASASSMTRGEALEILGLDEDASDEEVKQAHRRIIQKLHPDHGGSSFLAAQVNEAKTRLLG